MKKDQRWKHTYDWLEYIGMEERLGYKNCIEGQKCVEAAGKLPVKIHSYPENHTSFTLAFILYLLFQ